MHRAVSVEPGYFSPLISGAAGLGRCLLGPDKDAVCGPLPVACVVARLHRPYPPAKGGRRVEGVIFIHLLPQFNLANMGISLSCWMLKKKTHPPPELGGFLIGALISFGVISP